jgi:putative CocE/NonD family hydrolase
VKPTVKFIFLFLIAAFAFAQQQHPFNVTQEEVKIPMRDGIKLAATLFHPADDEKYPALVFRTPYNKAAESRDLPLKAAKSGYAVFLVDVRGRYASEGKFTAYVHEKQDGYDTIEWIAHSRYCNGKVGSWGRSYRGYDQWLALSQAPPSLTAAVPEMTPVHSHQFFYVGGAFSYSWLDWFVPLIIPDLRRRANDHSGPWDEDEAYKEWEKRKREAYKFRPLAENPELKQYAPEYFEWLTHPEKSDFWKFADVDQDFPKMKTPVLLISGWYDNVYGTLGATEGFNRMRSEGGSPQAREETRLMLGPWQHGAISVTKTKLGIADFGASAGVDYDSVLLRWFDHLMKDKPAPPTPPVSIFVMGANQWRYENEWPLKRQLETSFYLQDGGSLTPASPATGKPDQYVFDPADPVWDPTNEASEPFDQKEIEARKDVLVYTSQPLTQDLEATGRIIAELFVSSSAKDTDFAITFCDVSPEGVSMNLTSMDAGFLRMRYRNGFEKQELMQPGSIYKIRIDNLITSNLFRKGHRIRLQITSSKTPHYDPNTNTGGNLATDTELLKATQTIYHDREHPSRLILPVIR